MSTYDLRTTTLVAGGAAFGQLTDGRAVFIEGGAPDELVQVEIIKEDRRWARARVLRVLEPSKDRIIPPFQPSQLGGATWSHITYSAQLRAKENIVRTALERIGKLEHPVILPIIASPEEWAYRNRIELTFGERNGELILGTLASGSDNVVEEAEGSALFGATAEPIIERVLVWARANGYRAWQSRQGGGVLRSLIIRRGIQSRDLVVNLVTTSAVTPDPALAEVLTGLQISGILWSANDMSNAVLRIDATEVLAGRPSITEQLLDMPVVYHATSFFQANVHAAECLLKALRSQLLNPFEIVDLYAGVGVFGLGVSKRGILLTLVEVSTQATRDSRENAQRLGRLRDATIVEASAEAYVRLYKLPARATVIVDPPRTGLDRSVLRALLRDAPSQVAYISCDPATLARDLKLLGEAYIPVYIQPFDFFPQTPHVETLVMLTHRSDS